MSFGQKCLFLSLATIFLSSCANLNQNVRTDINVLKAKVANLEATMHRSQDEESSVKDVVVGEQKRGEYLQQQIFELANRVDSLEKGSGRSTRSSASRTGTAKASTSGKFISDKMTSPPSVKEVQLTLRNAGYYDGAIDGIPGSGSRQAVKKFQRNNGLTADGIVGQQTWRRLKKYL